MALDITGKIIQIMPATSGVSKAGKDWTKQEFVIETQEQYPRKVMMSTMNDKANLSRFAVGNTITASINIESREYNGRFYTDVSCWKLDGNGTQQAAPAQQQTNTPPPAAQNLVEGTDLPF